jgi:hypothetical protein
MTAMPMPDPNSDDAEREAKRRAIRKARESVERDGVIGDAEMSAWLESWGTANELPPPAPSPWK